MQRDCDICRFYTALPNKVEEEKIGECRRYPPSVAPGAINGKTPNPHQWSFPIVRSTAHSCGDFIELLPAQYEAKSNRG